MDLEQLLQAIAQIDDMNDAIAVSLAAIDRIQQINAADGNDQN